MKLFSANQWIKNLLLFVPAIFAGIIFDWNLSLKLSAAFAGFSLITSSVYIMNDVHDIPTDIYHPEKRDKPLTAGLIPKNRAYLFAVMVLIIGCIAMYLVSIEVLFLGLLYVVNNVLYTYFLKQIPIVDLISLCTGYYIRLFIGGSIAQVPLSNWLLLGVSVLAIYILLLKRYSDVVYYESTGVQLRKTVTFYKMLPLKMLTWIFIIVLTFCYMGYLHFVFRKYSVLSDHLAFYTVPLISVILVIYQRQYIKAPFLDPLKVLFNMWQLVVLTIVLFLSLVTMRYY